MDNLIVACVRTGQRYGLEYVERLRNGVARNLAVPHSFVCLTDEHFYMEGVRIEPVVGLAGWWGKMGYFRSWWRNNHDVICLDLDTVVVGDLSPLARVAASHPFTICRNFARDAGISPAKWPCTYNSSVMTIGHSLGEKVWLDFAKRSQEIQKRNVAYGDQKAIEELLGSEAPLLQTLLPDGFFLNYRNLTDTKPKDAAIVNFGGNKKPDNCEHGWVVEQWKL